MKDFYYILGTEPNATSIEIREAYKKLSKKFHPDLNENDYYFESHFKEISEAYNVLNDPYKRREYDAMQKKAVFAAEPQARQKLPLPKNKHINLAFTAVLIGITTLFGYYVYHALYSSKKTVVPSVAVVAPTPAVKHHKRKHKIKAAAQANNIAKAKIDTPKFKAIQTPAVIAKAVPKPAVTTPKTTLLPVQSVTPPPVQLPSNLYMANIRANATGVVYLRSEDNYTSDVLANIPNNAKVIVMEQGKTFCKVSFNNETGYVPKWTLLAR